MDKFILITGGTKGIGKAVASCLGKAGYNLILTYASDQAAAEEVRSELVGRFDIQVSILRADISDRNTIGVIDSFLEENRLRLDGLVFNAGMTCRDPFEELSFEDWERVFFANIHFPVFLLQKIVGRINKGGSIVFTGSLMGIQPHSVSLAYGVTKSAVHALVKNMVKFLVPYELRVNAVAPGFVDTEWQKTKPAEIRRNIENKVSLGRFCDPDELAEVYKMLIENSYFNGEEVRSELVGRFDIQVSILRADISDRNTIGVIDSFLEENRLRLDGLVFNAGMTCRDPFEELSFEDWERVFFANIHFPVFLLQKIVGRINKGGSIVFTGSLMGIQPHSVSLAYGVTKSAVHALVKNMVKFLVPYELRVNAVAPGFVDTEWQKTKPAEIRRNIENKVSLGRFCDPDELAEVYKMLIENSYFNGEVVVVDGGYSYK